MRNESDRNELRLVFDTVQQEINAVTMVNTLIGLSGIIQGVNAGLDTGRNVDIRIKALEGGSFVVNIELLSTALESIKNLFAGTDAKTVTEILTVFLAILKISKDLQGEKPEPTKSEENGSQSGGTVSLVKSNGNQLSVDARTYNLILTNGEVKQGLATASSAIANDPEVRGFLVQDIEEHTLFEATREEFGNMALTEDIIEERRIVTRREQLAVVKPSFDPRYTWDFSLSGVRIVARIEDEPFMTLVSLREEQFGAGDILDVDLLVIQVWDVKLRAYRDSQYRVVKVHKHLPGEKTGNLFKQD